jgi:hypothetical protein
MAKTEGKTPTAIPQDIKGAVIGLAICRASLREARDAVKHYEERINVWMPGGARLLASNAALVADLIRENNELAAKRARQAMR